MESLSLSENVSYDTTISDHYIVTRNKDDIDLIRVGKKPVLKRNFGFMAILGFNCLILTTWEGPFLTIKAGLENGGPAGLVYGFLVVWAGILATFISLAELASMAPTAGGQYHWVSMLAPQNCKKFLSFLTGWLTVCGWQGTLIGSAYISGGLFQGFVQVVDSSYTPHLWQATLFYYAVILFSIFIDAVLGPILPGIESFMMVFYTLGFFSTLVPLVYLAPHSSPNEVFTTFYDGGNWGSQTVSVLVGLSGYAFTFLGSDSVYHMSEEVRNASTVVPRTIVWGIVLDGIFGLAMLIAFLFCLGSVDAVINTSYVDPFIEVFFTATHSRAGTAVMVAIIIIVDLALSLTSMAASARMLWAFARDRGLPFWRFLSRVNRRTTIPINSIVVTAVFAFLIGLISIGSSVAFNDVISLALSSLYLSYFVAISLLLWRRCCPEGIIDAQKSSKDSRSTQLHTHLTLSPNQPRPLVWGPWRIRPAWLGTAINIFACFYLIIVFFFSLWPPAQPVSASTMNYAVAVTGGVMLFSCFYYVFSAHKTFKGPRIEIKMASRA